MNKNVNLKSIRIDGGTQGRVALDLGVVAEYAESLTDAVELPPIVLFHDGTEHWLADGFHRYFAYKEKDRASIPAVVREGTQRDAVLYSLSANGTHGLRRTNEDKHKSVNTMLADAEWCKLSDREIAKHCGVSHTFVANVRTPKPVAKPKLKIPPAPTPKPEGAAAPAPAPAPAPSPATSPAPAPEGTEPAGATEGGAAPTDGVATVATPEVPASKPAQTYAQKIAEAAHGGLELSDIIEEQAIELKALREQVAAAEADDLKAETMKWRRIAEVARNRQNELMASVNEREAELKRHIKSLRRIGAAVGEDDPSKVAATVEEFVRSVKVGA